MAFEDVRIRHGPDFLIALGDKTLLVKANGARDGRWFGSCGGRWFSLGIRSRGIQASKSEKA